jgi:hypothetical protein
MFNIMMRLSQEIDLDDAACAGRTLIDTNIRLMAYFVKASLSNYWDDGSDI